LACKLTIRMMKKHSSIVWGRGKNIGTTDRILKVWFFWIIWIMKQVFRKDKRLICLCMYLIKAIGWNNVNMYTFCFQNVFLVNIYLHASWHPDIIGIFKNFIFHKIDLNKLLQWQYNFMTISTLHSKTIKIFSLKFFIFRCHSLWSLLFLILYRTITLNWILKHLNIYFFANNFL